MSSNEVYTELVIIEETFRDKTYNECSFCNITFDKCSFKNVRFINCILHDVNFDSCTSNDMVFEDCEFRSAMFMKSKFKSTSFTELTRIFDSRFYNNIFLDTEFGACEVVGSVSNRPQSLSGTRTRGLPMTNRSFYDTADVGEILYKQPLKREYGQLNITAIDIPGEQIAYDPIHGKVQISSIADRPDTVAFLYGKEFFIVTKKNIRKMISAKSSGNQQPDNIDIVERFAFPKLPKNIMVLTRDLEIVIRTDVILLKIAVKKDPSNESLNFNSILLNGNEVKNYDGVMHELQQIIVTDSKLSTKEKKITVDFATNIHKHSGGKTKKSRRIDLCCNRNRNNEKRKNITRK